MPAKEAHRWERNGNHPHDGSAALEGKVVRYYRHPDFSGEKLCPHCHKIMLDHGWIDEGDDGHVVCPGDWIITDENGGHYPCKPIVFYAAYKELNQGGG